ncbi:tetratricopeptide repeat protein [Plebeiibacterium marinum]|uniref:Tetratricopeptide repeat protein n=1 Tax=Plebeiibacterium marinum TaxID=2992111 RepID=A0AAE3SM89_9BACT|nr:tetratricopeptide repeat protein [Plebeiobacterium marinum]MCW3807295.1 tetratricopeptide repeat protein [Plebeiobacterium marinum]
MKLSRKTIIICFLLFLAGHLTAISAQFQILSDTLNTNNASEISEAKLLEHNYKLYKAINAYQKIYQRDTTNLEILKELESLYTNTSQYQEALDFTLKILKYQPQNNHYRIKSGLLYKKLDEHKKALQILKNIRWQDPHNLYIITQIADTYRDINAADSALVYYTKACEMNPTTSNLIKGADILLKNKKNTEALHFLNTYYSKKQHCSKVLQRLYGKTQYVNDSIYDAYEIFNDLYKNGDSSQVTSKFLGLSCWKISHFTRGESVLENYIKKDTTDYLAYYVLGICCKRNNNFNKSIAYLNKSLELYTPDSKTMAMIHKGIAESFEWMMEYKQAIAHYKLISNYSPENIFGEYKIAMIYDYEIKNKEKALQCYNNLINKINREDSTSESQIETFCKMRVAKLNETLFWEKEN